MVRMLAATVVAFLLAVAAVVSVVADAEAFPVVVEVFN